jgi:hypothetical protein
VRGGTGIPLRFGPGAEPESGPAGAGGGPGIRGLCWPQLLSPSKCRPPAGLLKSLIGYSQGREAEGGPDVRVCRPVPKSDLSNHRATAVVRLLDGYANPAPNLAQQGSWARKNPSPGQLGEGSWASQLAHAPLG